MAGTGLAVRPDAILDTAGGGGVVWTDERIKTLRSTLAKDCTPAQFELALAFCQRTGLDPFLRQVHIVVRDGRLTLQIGIDGHRAIALRSGVYAGEEGPLYAGKDGIYTDTWLSSEPPVAAKVTVWRHDYPRPFPAVVLYREFAALAGKSPIWAAAPIHMLGIRASSHAFRKAFQQELAAHERIGLAMGVAVESAPEVARFEDVAAIDLLPAAAVLHLPDQTVDDRGGGTGETGAATVEDPAADPLGEPQGITDPVLMAAIERWDRAVEAAGAAGVTYRAASLLGKTAAQIEAYAARLEAAIAERGR